MLAAVDVIGSAGQGGVGHDVHGERGDVGRADHPSDRQRRAELVAASFEVLAEQRPGERRVDESGRDQVDPDRRDFDREVGAQGAQRGGGRGSKRQARSAFPAGAGHEQQRATGPYFADRLLRDSDSQP